MSARPGFALALVPLLLLSGCGGKGPSDPSSSGAPQPQDIALLSGFVLDAAVAPVEGATVNVHGTNATTTTDAEGGYRFDEVPVAAPIVVIVEADGYVTSSKS